MNALSPLNPILALALSPLLVGIINRVKAVFAGRRGQPVLQTYIDLWKLFHKAAVYSHTTTWVFRAGPIVNLACLLAALALLPLGHLPAPLRFAGDLVLFAYLLGLGRFFTVAAAMDTGSSFEGMGGSREVQFAVFAEPALLIGMAALARMTGAFSLSEMVGALTSPFASNGHLLLLLLAAAFFIVFLAENCRIPVDDPNTHLELTMIHEVMALDHGGVDLGFILYGSCLKLWILGSLVVSLLVPATGRLLPDVAAAVAGVFLLAAATGIVESTTARLRLLRVPQLLVGACVLSGLTLLLTLR